MAHKTPTAESEMIRLHDSAQRAPDKKQLTNEILDEVERRIRDSSPNENEYNYAAWVLEIINNMRGE